MGNVSPPPRPRRPHTKSCLRCQLHSHACQGSSPIDCPCPPSPLPTLALHSTFHAAAKITFLPLRAGGGHLCLKCLWPSPSLIRTLLVSVGSQAWPEHCWHLWVIFPQAPPCNPPSRLHVLSVTDVTLPSAFLTCCKHGATCLSCLQFHSPVTVPFQWHLRRDGLQPGSACIALPHGTTVTLHFISLPCSPVSSGRPIVGTSKTPVVIQMANAQ